MTSSQILQNINKLHSKPGHEQVKFTLCDILKDALYAKDDEIDLEERLSCRGRIDTLWRQTIFEIKRNLNRELQDAQDQIKRYIKSKEKDTGIKHIGIATDGKKYIVYILHKDKLKQISDFTIQKDKPNEFILWLESVVLIKDHLKATSENICKEIGQRKEIGQQSPLCQSSLILIQSLWKKVKNKPEVKLKYDLWKKAVENVYGKECIEESLFIEHTYLTIISKAIGHIAFFDTIPQSGKDLLSGKGFKDASVFGVIENDFFSWIASDQEGSKLILKIASHINRFDFSKIQADILKDLYENLIRQGPKHRLGEYYTPDWLAERICKEAIENPLQQRVIDPACGSGTFLFHAIKLLISKAQTENISSEKTIDLICQNIAGIDIHPVAVIFSRITYLLAILEKIEEGRPDNLNIPVYLGDSLQWNKYKQHGNSHLKVLVPPEQEKANSRQLIFPESICQESEKFEDILRRMIGLAGEHKKDSAFKAWMQKNYKEYSNQNEFKILLKTYQELVSLHKENRNHIWGYMARNLTRPIWLSSEKQKADVVIGNPPWLKYNSMTNDMQKNFKDECCAIKLLHSNKNNSKFQTSQDISTYFFVRSIELYMKETGKLAFVMPYGVINGDHHRAFREGSFSRNSDTQISIKFTNAWLFDSKVKNLFKTTCCVLFSQRRKPSEASLPQEDIFYFKGKLPQKNINLEEANKALSYEKKEWPLSHYNDPSEYSYYFDKFKQGASLVPRRFIFVEKMQGGKLGVLKKTPLVKGVTSSQDKEPWKSIDPIENKMESQFLKPVYTGKSIAPFRIIDDAKLAVIPYDNQVMNSFEAEQKGYTYLSQYLKRAEDIWKANSSEKMTFKERINYQKLLENQFPISKLRIVYTASGTYPAAVLLEDIKGVIDTSLYWSPVDSQDEGIYLEGILNSECILNQVQPLQSQGNHGPRHFHTHLLKPSFPKYNPSDSLHKDIVIQVKEIKKIAQNVEIKPQWKFQRIRQEIREEIESTNAWEKLNNLISQLLKTTQEAIFTKESRIEKEIKHIEEIQEKEEQKEI